MIPVYRDGSGPDHDLRLPHAFNGLTINDPADDPKDTIEVNAVTPQTEFHAIAERHQSRDGLEVYGARKVRRIYRVDGTIRAPTIARLCDQIAALGHAFDPALLTRDNPDAQGFLPYDFSVPTLNTTDFPTGLVPSRVYARPAAQPEPTISYDRGNAAFFTVALLLADPRRYLQSASTYSAGAGTVDNGLATYPSWPTLTLTMAGPGSATFTFRNDTVGGDQLVLDLSALAATDVVVVDMERRTIKLNGDDAMHLFVSGTYWDLVPGDNVVNRFNDANVSSVIEWRPAFSL